jgi:hypothetical protein
MTDVPLADETAVRLRQAGIHPDDPALTEVAATNREAAAREERRLAFERRQADQLAEWRQAQAAHNRAQRNRRGKRAT